MILSLILCLCLLSLYIVSHSIWTKGFAPEMKSETHIPLSCRDLTYITQLDDLNHWSLDDLAAAIKEATCKAAVQSGKPADYYTIAGCIAGGEAGVDMADLLSEKFCVLSNGAKGDFANRRDKKVQVRLLSPSRFDGASLVVVYLLAFVHVTTARPNSQGWNEICPPGLWKDI